MAFIQALEWNFGLPSKCNPFSVVILMHTKNVNLWNRIQLGIIRANGLRTTVYTPSYDNTATRVRARKSCKIAAWAGINAIEMTEYNPNAILIMNAIISMCSRSAFICHFQFIGSPLSSKLCIRPIRARQITKKNIAIGIESIWRLGESSFMRRHRSIADFFTHFFQVNAWWHAASWSTYCSDSN